MTSEPVNDLSWAGEVLYRRLMSVADDFGRYYAKPSLIRAHCYPLRLDAVSDSDIGKWLTECVNAGLVRVYPASDGKRYLEILKFDQQVRAKKSRYPDECVADATQTHSNGAADAPVFVVESVVVCEAVESSARQSALATKQSNPQGTRLPPEWVLPEEWARWALDERKDWTLLEVERVGLVFRDHWVGKAGKDARRSDWFATWRNWVRNERRDYRTRPDGAKQPTLAERRARNMDILTGKVVPNGGSVIDSVARAVDNPPVLALSGDLREPDGNDVGGR